MNLKIIMTTILVLYTIGMIAVAVIPHLSGVQGIENKDKIIHFIEFFIFTILLLSTLAIDGSRDYYAWALLVVLVLILVSEAVQIPIIGRTFSVNDMMADMAGASLGFLVFWLGRLEWKRLKQ